MATMKNRPVAFNIENDEDKKRLHHINSIKNFSGYVKSLIDQDMNRKDTKQVLGTGICIKGGVEKKL